MNLLGPFKGIQRYNLNTLQKDLFTRTVMMLNVYIGHIHHLFSIKYEIQVTPMNSASKHIEMA